MSIVDEALPFTAPVKFVFRVNHSFLNYTSRPITVPNRFNALVRDYGLDAHYVHIHAFNGEQFDGRIYGSRNQNGTYEYHQIVINGRDGDALSQLPLGQEITVRISRGARGVEVHISR
jgi:hypothetical protein